jgi:putative heme-binding domain-containing protein
LKNFLIEQTDSDLKSLATNLAQKIGLSMDADLMRSQISDKNLDAQVRVANLNSMADLGLAKDNELLISLLQDEGEEVRANAFWHCIDRGLPNVLNLGLQAIKGDTFLVARKVMEGLVVKFPESMIDLWKVRELELRPELWLDLYLLLSNNDHAESKKVAALYAAGEPSRIHALSLYGGDLESGEKVFRNQGACMQCHQIDKEGGVQGPSLSLVGDRLEVGKLLESIVNPSAEITPGYGLSTISTTDGISMVGRVVESADKNDSIVLISPDQKETIIERIDIESISPPVSAMPALGLTLSPVDLRDLIAFLKSRNEEYLLSVKNNKHLNVKHGEQ